jgi:MOSC domain-containing protein YiiM
MQAIVKKTGNGLHCIVKKTLGFKEGDVVEIVKPEEVDAMVDKAFDRLLGSEALKERTLQILNENEEFKKFKESL